MRKQLIENAVYEVATQVRADDAQLCRFAATSSLRGDVVEDAVVAEVELIDHRGREDVGLADGDIASAKAPPLKASSLNARAQRNLLPGFATTAGMSIRSTNVSMVIPTRAAANRACTSTAMLNAAQKKPRPTR